MLKVQVLGIRNVTRLKVSPLDDDKHASTHIDMRTRTSHTGLNIRVFYGFTNVFCQGLCC